MLQLLGLLLILDYESVKEPGASNLELGAVGVLLDFDALGFLKKKLFKLMSALVRMNAAAVANFGLESYFSHILNF